MIVLQANIIALPNEEETRKNLTNSVHSLELVVFMCVVFWASDIDKDDQMSFSLKKKMSRPVLIVNQRGFCIEWLT